MPGVVAIFTGADWVAARLMTLADEPVSIPSPPPLSGRADYTAGHDREAGTVVVRETGSGEQVRLGVLGHVPVALPVALRGVGVAGSRCGMCHTRVGYDAGSQARSLGKL